MAELSFDREAYLKFKNGEHDLADSRLASFLTNQFEEGEAAAKAAWDEPNQWLYNFWTWKF